MSVEKLIIATKNNNKLIEIKDILGELRLKIFSLFDIGMNVEIIEDGKTFYENASKKALTVSKEIPDGYVVGEDSGLEVEFLDGAPGVYSKRYAGAEANDVDNNSKLLMALEGIESSRRQASFCCCLVLARNGELINSFEGRLKGQIDFEPKGSGGFGYDPVFYLSLYNKTVAQLDPKVKNEISHRAKAFRELKKYLQKQNL